MSRLRYRIARWLVGPFFALPEDGSWLVNRKDGVTFGIRVAEWHGELQTILPSYGDLEAGPAFRPHSSTGTFEGSFGAPKP